jgi:hypothetical protein
LRGIKNDSGKAFHMSVPSLDYYDIKFALNHTSSIVPQKVKP